MSTIQFIKTTPEEQTEAQERRLRAWREFSGERDDEESFIAYHIHSACVNRSGHQAYTILEVRDRIRFLIWNGLLYPEAVSKFFRLEEFGRDRK